MTFANFGPNDPQNPRAVFPKMITNFGLSKRLASPSPFWAQPPYLPKFWAQNFLLRLNLAKPKPNSQSFPNLASRVPYRGQTLKFWAKFWPKISQFWLNLAKPNSQLAQTMSILGPEWAQNRPTFGPRQRPKRNAQGRFWPIYGPKSENLGSRSEPKFPALPKPCLFWAQNGPKIASLLGLDRGPKGTLKADLGHLLAQIC